MINLDAYFQRICFSGTTTADAGTLRLLHEAHVAHIPFENLDVLVGQPIELSDSALMAKLAGTARGGYCFEQNILFWRVLQRMGYSVFPLGARVVFGRTPSDPPRPHTHAALLVESSRERWLADVGFGGVGLLEPLPLVSGHVAKLPLARFRLEEYAQGQWRLEGDQGKGWQGLYTFSLEPRFIADYEMANYYCSTNPRSRFRRMLYLSKVQREKRLLLQGNWFYDQSKAGICKTKVTSMPQLQDIISEQFEIDFRAHDLAPELLSEHGAN